MDDLEDLEKELNDVLGEEDEQEDLSKKETRKVVTTPVGRVALDEHGNLIDEEGNLVQMQQKTMLSINKRMEESKRDKEQEQQKRPKKNQKWKLLNREDVEKREEEEAYFDKRLQSRKRHRRDQDDGAFHFFEKGHFIKKAKKKQLDEVVHDTLKAIQSEYKASFEEEEEAEKYNIQDESPHALQQHASAVMADPSLKESQYYKIYEMSRTQVQYGVVPSLLGSNYFLTKTLYEIQTTSSEKPNIDQKTQEGRNEEWWDRNIFHTETENENENTNHGFIQHPSYVTPKMPIPPKTQIMKLMKTTKELKKLRKQLRMQRERKKQQQIQLGLVEPPPPKANLRNFMKVYLHDALQDPTKLEKRIREEVAQRVQDHLQRGLESKLTLSERKENRYHKDIRLEKKELRGALLLIQSLKHQQQNMKVKTAAKKLNLSAKICVNTMPAHHHHEHLHPIGNIVFIEGHTKNVHRFIHRMLTHVKWNLTDQNIPIHYDNPYDPRKNHCHLLWMGTLDQHYFQGVSFTHFENLQGLRQVFRKAKFPEIFDFCVLNQKLAIHQTSDK